MTIPPDIEILARLNFSKTPAFARDRPDDPIRPSKNEDGAVVMSNMDGLPKWHWFRGDAERDARFLQMNGWELRRVGE